MRVQATLCVDNLEIQSHQSFNRDAVKIPFTPTTKGCDKAPEGAAVDGEICFLKSWLETVHEMQDNHENPGTVFIVALGRVGQIEL